MAESDFNHVTNTAHFLTRNQHPSHLWMATKGKERRLFKTALLETIVSKVIWELF